MYNRIPGGKAQSTTPTYFNQDQLGMGVDVEMEHTVDPSIAQEIAMDHLMESPEYYTHLKEMESKMAALEPEWIQRMKKGWLQQVKRAGSAETTVEGIQNLKAVIHWLDQLAKDLLFNKGLYAPKGLSTITARESKKIVGNLREVERRLHLGLFQLENLQNSTDVNHDSYQRSGGRILEFYTDQNPRNPQEAINKAAQEYVQETLQEASTLFTRKAIRNLNETAAKYTWDKKPVELDFNIGRVHVINEDQGSDGSYLYRMENQDVDVVETTDYVQPLKEAYALLQRRNLDFLWYGEMFIQCQECGGSVPQGFEDSLVAAHYEFNTDRVVIFSRPSPHLTEIILHELGHRYYFRFMDAGDRARFDSYFGQVAATSNYGATSSVEDFAEVFMNYVLGKDLTSDQFGRFKTFLGKTNRRASSTYSHIDFTPPQGVADAAARGLELRQKASPANRGGLTPAEASKEGIGSGVQRAVNLKNQDNISPDVIRQMVAFFARHKKNKSINPENKNTPWNDKGYVAWLLWGGDPGERWANKVLQQMESADGLKKAWGKYAAVDGASIDLDLRKFRESYEKAIDTRDPFLMRPMVYLVFKAGQSLVLKLVTLKQPPNQKLFDVARKEFARTRDFDYVAWFEKHKRMLEYLLTSDTWPDLSPGNDETMIGKIRVINQTPNDIDKTMSLVRQAVTHINNSGVPGLSKVLYGDVFIVGDIARKKGLAARYFLTSDRIEVISVKRFSDLGLHSLIHEFGHRFWNKFMDTNVKAKWKAHHTQMTYGKLETRSLVVGDTLPFYKGNPTIIDRQDRLLIVQYEDGTTMKADPMQVYTHFAEYTKQMRFPTPYAASDVEEHFCEVLALYCMGELKEPHVETFKSTIIDNL